MATVLCVDDSELTLRLRKLLLERLGHTIISATTGEQALSLFQLVNFDLVLCDYHMPGETGAEIATRMRSMRAGVPFVLVSGEIDVPAELPGIDATFLKGDAPENLFQIVSSLLSTRSESRTQLMPAVAAGA